MSICLPKGFKIGHADNDRTGVTVVLCEDGATGGCDCRGGATGTRETDLLKTEKMMEKVNAVALCGGSAYGLEAASGVMDFLRERGKGFKVGAHVVPIVPAAVLYDLGEKFDYPDKKMGQDACQNATTTPVFGRVGAGKGATVGKIRGAKHASHGGIGGATVNVMGINITAIVAVNAFGDVVDPDSGAVLAGARDRKGGFLNTTQTILNGQIMRLLLGTNTTIGCILTDAKITKAEANKLAAIGHNGLARTISPVHTDYDGDTLFCLSSGRKKVINFMMLEVGAVKAVECAIINAITGTDFVFPDFEDFESTDTEQEGERGDKL